MANIKIGVKGLNELMTQLSVLSNATEVVEKSLDRSMGIIKAQAKLLAPTSPGGGNLRNSIRTRTVVRGKKVISAIFSSCGYSMYVELGTGRVGQSSPCATRQIIHPTYRQTSWVYTTDGGRTFHRTNGMKAQPYMYPAIENNKRLIVEHLKRDMLQEINSRR